MHVHHRSTPGFAPAGSLPPPRAGGGAPFGADGLGFADLVDLVNPLHHLPVVGQIYRRLTGDVIAPALRIAGGALFGGPLGAAFAAAGIAVDAVVDGAADASAAAALAASPARGGWIVASGRPREAGAAPGTPVQPDAPLPPARPAPRRGGWMVAAAYAMADARRAGLDTRA